MDIQPFLKVMSDKGGSDLFFSTGAPVTLKIEGRSQALNNTALKPGVIKALAYSIMDNEQIEEFEQELEMNLAISAPGAGRFRVNIFRQRGEVSMVIRNINSQIPDTSHLNLPPILHELIMEPRGLILVVGSTGSGKSTTLASMIQYRNNHAPGHILTIEDPIEYIYSHNKCIINQREVGLDTNSYENALKNALREAPDVILIGEIRDNNTMKHAITYAETGHLCLSTLHANNAKQTLDRILGLSEENHQQILGDLSRNLRAIVSQRLIIGNNGKRLPAVEIMINSAYVADLIQQARFDDLKSAMEEGMDVGMMTFDEALYRLYRDGKIDEESALKNADSRNDLQLKIRLSGGRDTTQAKEEADSSVDLGNILIDESML